MKLSIKIKLSFFLAVLLLLTVSILTILVLRGIQEYQQKRNEDFLAQQSRIANLYIRQNYLIALTEDPQSTDQFLKQQGQEMAMDLGLMSGMHVVIYDQAGIERGNSLPNANTMNHSEAMEYVLKGKVAYQIIDDNLYYYAPLHNLDEQMGVIHFQYSLQESFHFYHTIQTLFYQIGTVIFIISFLVGYLYFNRLTGGILNLKQAVEKIQSGEYRAFSPLKRKDELGALSQGIYFMSKQIEENIAAMQKEEEKLKQAVNILKELEQKQKQFIGSITHEFKTPLTVMKAYVDLMEIYPDDPKLITDAKQNIGKETQRLVEMVDKVLHLASLEKYDFTSQAEKIEVKEELQALCERMKGKAQKFGLQMETDLEKASIWADKESFTHIFINLLDNAIKYNIPGGKIMVHNEIQDGQVRIEVKDTGIGIPVDLQEKIFAPFYTVHKDRSRQSGGTGLGLALVKELVEKQKGSIALLESEGKGSNFMVSFQVYHST